MLPRCYMLNADMFKVHINPYPGLSFVVTQRVFSAIESLDLENIRVDDIEVEEE
ncbi:MAG: hypothetical protein ACQESR_24560 [Planctomycetota bacterium]